MPEVLSSDAPLIRGPVPLMRSAAIGVAAVLIAGAGVVTIGFAGGGPQPEDVLPASAIAVAKVDLDPSLSQKKAIYQLGRRFSWVKTRSVSSVKDDLLSALLTSEDLDYNRDIKPWLGDRAAVAAVPDKSPGGFAVVAAVQFTDRARADTTLKDAKTKASSPFAYAFSGSYVILATTQDEAYRYAKAGKHLADSAAYAKAVAALGGDQLVTGWADVKGVYDALPAASRKQFDVTQRPAGSFVIGAHANSHYLEIQGKTVDVGDSLQQYGSTSFGSSKGHHLIGAMPSDATAAFEVTGLGDSLTKAYDALTRQPQFAAIQKSAKDYGLALPDDIRTLFGTDLAAAVFGDLKAGTTAAAAHVLTDDPAGAVRILNRAAASPGGQASFVVQTDSGGGYFIGTSPAAITSATAGTLGDSAPFKLALPDVQDAGFALYVSIGRAAAAAGNAPKELSSFEAFGMTANGQAGEFRIRLTVR